MEQISKLQRFIKGMGLDHKQERAIFAEIERLKQPTRHVEWGPTRPDGSATGIITEEPSKRDKFQDTMAENDSAMQAGFDLMDFIEGLNLPAESHNELVGLIDRYRGECEEGR